MVDTQKSIFYDQNCSATKYAFCTTKVVSRRRVSLVSFHSFQLSGFCVYALSITPCSSPNNLITTGNCADVALQVTKVINNTSYFDNDPNSLTSFTSTQSTSGQVTNLISNITAIKYHGSFQVTKTLSVDARTGFNTTVTALAQATLAAPTGYDIDTQGDPDHSDSVTDPYR